MEEQRHMTMPELRALRKKLCLSQAEAAKLLNVSVHQLCRYENGRIWSTPSYVCSNYQNVLELCQEGKIVYRKVRTRKDKKQS